MFRNPAAPLAPMTPHEVISAFEYLRAVQAAWLNGLVRPPFSGPSRPHVVVVPVRLPA
ncbi:hypothetical protein ACIOHS_43410 [Streptomyces sp. NPDC088253]|uniref:hypothetical protein n=1 Tax=Streptomyces sp. NPDC088253 TaxID=3365846 RepID=UPI0038019A70